MLLWKILVIFGLFGLMLIQGCNKRFDHIRPDKIFKHDKDKEEGQLEEWTGNEIDPCKSVCLVAGRHMDVGTVDVAMAGEDLLVTYNISEPGIYLEEIHLDIFAGIDQFKCHRKLSHGGAIPGKFSFKASWDQDEKIAKHTVKIPASYLDDIIGDADCFFIATHAALSNGETAWGGLCEKSDKGVSLDIAKQFPGANWSVYFEFCPEECTTSIDFTYAWEDLRDMPNDADYNDLVIQSDVIKSEDELKISFLASARGALYDHSFKIRIPMAGITGIFGVEDHDRDITDDGTNYIITVFRSTKKVLPDEFIDSKNIFANTDPRDNTCGTAVAEITFTIDDSFHYDADKPYDPFITVWPSEVAGTGGSYDLNIWELHNGDDTGSTWTKGGEEYPNGILIPRDWKWPLELQHITGPYPNFKSITEGWNKNWADNLADDSLVWSCNQ